MTARWKRLTAGGALLLAAIALAVVLYGPAVAFLLDLGGYQGPWRRLIPVRTRTVTTEDLHIATRDGPIDARLYEPSPPGRHTAVVFPGVHGGGVDEPRLALFCGRLASTGLTVICAPLPGLREYRITGQSTDMIEDVTAWAAGNRRLTPEGRVGLVGVSFAGGLALVAAGRPSLADRLEVVVSVGGYGDLPRALRYLCTGRLPDGTYRKPHEYGLAVVALAAAPHLVPAAEVPALEHAIRLYLDASLNAGSDRARAAALLGQARAAGAAMPEPGRSIVQAMTDADVRRLGDLLEPVVDKLGQDPALSPDRSPITHAPVFLIHGSTDNVIPSSETPLEAADLIRRGNPQVQWLLTPLLSHADLVGPLHPADAWRLIAFWRQVLNTLE